MHHFLSAKMAQIYAKATFTISAASSDRCSSRIFQRREPSDIGIQLRIDHCGREEAIGVRKFSNDLRTALRRAEIFKEDGQCKSACFQANSALHRKPDLLAMHLGRAKRRREKRGRDVKGKFRIIPNRSPFVSSGRHSFSTN